MGKNNKADIIKIPKDLVGTKLRCFLYPYHYKSDEDKQAIALLYKICKANLTDFQETNLIKDLELSAEEKNIILQNEWDKSENLEVKARCNDVLCRFEKQDKRPIIEKTSDLYLSAYKESEDTDFLIRAITARNIKALNDDTFFSSILSELDKIYDIPHQLCMLITALCKSYPVEKFTPIVPVIEQYRNNTVLQQDYYGERKYIDTLYKLDVLNADECHKEKALSFEKEADNIIENKQPNTVYPTIPDRYQNAYDEIFIIKAKEPLIYKRIKEKLIAEKQNFVDFLTTYGTKIKMPIPDGFKQRVKRYVKKVRLNNFCDTIKLFLLIPFVTQSEVEKYINACKKTSKVSLLFGTNRLDAKGNTIGTKDPEESLRTEAHIYSRQARLYILASFFGLHHWAHIKVEEDEVFYFLEKMRPQFIGEQNIVFWSKGISAGLNNDFITASHILMPQLEHALHNIAEIWHGNITTLEKQRQEAPTLGTILPKLKNIIDDEILFEMDSFLQSGIDVNFRNNLAHGLFAPFEIDKYTTYLLWMCLKLFFDKGIIVGQLPNNNKENGPSL